MKDEFKRALIVDSICRCRTCRRVEGHKINKLIRRRARARVKEATLREHLTEETELLC